jgi:aminomethyltransferase
MLRFTPFHPRTAPLVRAATWRRWSGFQVASAYEPVPDAEYAAIRNSAALIDVSPLHKYRITGKDSLRLLDRLVTRDVTRCRVGQVLYTPWCDHQGKVIDDGTVHRLDEEDFRLTSAEPNLRWLEMSAAGMDLSIEDESENVAALALQGPLARMVLEQATQMSLAGLRYFRLTGANVRGVPLVVSRTGYTGDLGYEIWVDAGHAVPLWDALMQEGAAFGIMPAGIWALDIARIEAGLVMLGVDYFSSHHAMIEDAI